MRDWKWCAVWALLSAAWCVSAATRWSATFDEPLYIARGLERWRSGSLDGLLRLGTMPLPIEVEALPLYVAERWRGAPFDVARDLDRILPWARAMNLCFWFIVLVYAYQIGASLVGRWGGRLAMALVACEPSLLAHAALATTDISLTACVLACAYHFHEGRTAGWLRRRGLPACWYAAAVLAKASGLFLVPFCMLVVTLSRPRSEWRATVRDAAAIVWLGLLLAFCYCGSDWRAEPSFVAWANALPHDAWLQPLMRWLADHLRIFPNAGDGLVRQIRHNLRGHGSYLLGVEHARALWWYFPVLLTIKLTESALWLPAVALARQPRSWLTWPMLTAIALVAYSVAFRVQLGIRMVLPLVAFWLIGTVVALHPKGGLRASRGSIVVAVAILWSGMSAISAWPQGLSYVNHFWGGSDDGYRLVSDSNYDWGQGLEDLLAWQQARGSDALALWYFGTDPRARQVPFHLVALHELPSGSADAVRAVVAGRLLAVGTTLLYGTTLTPSHAQVATWLRSQTPVARTQTFLIYDVGGADPNK